MNPITDEIIQTACLALTLISPILILWATIRLVRSYRRSRGKSAVAWAAVLLFATVSLVSGLTLHKFLKISFEARHLGEWVSKGTLIEVQSNGNWVSYRPYGFVFHENGYLEHQHYTPLAESDAYNVFTIPGYYKIIETTESNITMRIDGNEAGTFRLHFNGLGGMSLTYLPEVENGNTSKEKKIYKLTRPRKIGT